MADCTNNIVTVIEGVFGGLGVITCTVALVFAIVSRFYKDIVQRLIVYKLVTMLVYSLSQFLSFKYDDSQTYSCCYITTSNCLLYQPGIHLLANHYSLSLYCTPQGTEKL
uniref:Uncharacterized protein n=1 Tax=Amphimedon queenslandica TaxID=400682 RepID=A0A1X7UD15_AMPQE